MNTLREYKITEKSEHSEITLTATLYENGTIELNDGSSYDTFVVPKGIRGLRYLVAAMSMDEDIDE